MRVDQSHTTEMLNLEKVVKFNECLFGDLFKKDMTGHLSLKNAAKNYLIVPLRLSSLEPEEPLMMHDDSPQASILQYSLDFSLLEIGSLPLEERLKQS